MRGFVNNSPPSTRFPPLSTGPRFALYELKAGGKMNRLDLRLLTLLIATLVAGQLCAARLAYAQSGPSWSDDFDQDFTVKYEKMNITRESNNLQPKMRRARLVSSRGQNVDAPLLDIKKGTRVLATASSKKHKKRTHSNGHLSIKSRRSTKIATRLPAKKVKADKEVARRD